MRLDDYFTEPHVDVALTQRLKLFISALKSCDENIAHEDLRKLILYQSHHTAYEIHITHLMDGFVHIFNKRLKD